MEKTIKLNVTVDHKRFYNADSMFGVYGFTANTNGDKIKYKDVFGKFVVSGSTPELKVGESYDIEIVPSYHPKYGKGYQFVAVKPKRPKTPEEQREYIKLMLTPTQYEEIVKVYPNEPILDLMEKDEFDYTKIKGIKESTYQKIKQKLFENLEIQEALVELKDLKITLEAMKKLIDHFGSAEIVVKKVKENIYELCNVPMFGFKKVDEYALNRGDSPTNRNRITAGIKYVLQKDAEKGHSWMKRKDLEKELVKLLNIEIDYITDTLNELEQEDSSKLYFDGERVALYTNYFYENKIKEKLISLLNQPCNTMDENIDKTIEEIEEKGGFKYTDEQKEAIKKAVNNNVLILNGKAGTGKSFTIKGILEVLKGYSYMTCALSGKAAQILANNGLEAKTIHRMLGVDHNGKFVHNEENKLPYNIVILDEASMVNNHLVYSILIALKDDAKFIMAGDSGQLPSIGTGAVFDDLLKADILPRQELTIVQRQAQKSGILSTANKIRSGEHINDNEDYETKIFGELRDMVLIPVDSETDIKNMVLDISKRKTKEDLKDFQVITGRVDAGDLSVKNLNIELQKLFNTYENEWEEKSRPKITRGGYTYKEGDKIIQNGNNYDAKIYNEFSDIFDDEEKTTEVFNGTMGEIVKIELDNDKTRQEHKVYIKFEDIDDLVIYNTSDLQQISLAYAISTHKSQGSTIKHVLFVFDYASYMLLSREFVYTGITRASEGCILIADNRALRHAISKTTGGSRRTFLKELLLSEERQLENNFTVI